MISLVPDDVGKPTFKLEKAEVKEGICSWENPIYVSVKMIKEPKSGIVREKIYHFVVATVSRMNSTINVFFYSSCEERKKKREDFLSFFFLSKNGFSGFFKIWIFGRSVD